MKKPGAGSSKAGLGSIGKSGLGSGKTGITSSKGSVMGSSSKSGSSTTKTLSSTTKSSFSPLSKSSGAPISKSASPKPSKSFDFSPSKSKPLIPSSPKSYPSSSSYNAYGTPKSGKSSTFGIIWIPTGKRNKKKDIVLNYNNDDRRRERSPSFYKFMSGDSHDQTHKKTDDAGLLIGQDRKLPTAAIAATETAVAANLPASNLDEKQLLILQDNDASKEAAGDAKDNDTDEDNDYLSNEEPVRHKLPDTSEPDSVYLRPPPPHKARSTASTSEEDSCGIKCLYYTLQCCDCVLM